MRSRLLSETALCAAALVGLAAPADAQTKVAPIAVTVGGYMEQTFGYADNEKGAGGLADPTGFQQQSDAEIWFGGRTTLANGITVGFDVQLEANSRSSDTIDESYMFIDGTFGRLVLGSENDVAYLHGVSAPRAKNSFDINESNLLNYIRQPTDFTFQDGTLPDATGDFNKVNYFTPRFWGIQGAASFTPSALEDTTAFAPADRNTTRTYAWTLSANLQQRFDEFQIAASIGWVYAPGVEATSATPGLDNEFQDFAAGLQVGWRGFAAGASYRRLVNSEGPQDGTVWIVGVGYDPGPWAISLHRLESDQRGSNTIDGRDNGIFYQLAGAYVLGPGVNLIGGLIYFDFDEETPGNQDNEGWGAVAGIRITF